MIDSTLAAGFSAASAFFNGGVSGGLTGSWMILAACSFLTFLAAF